MSDSLKNLIELNQEKQTSLERRHSVLKGDIHKRAIRWIAKKDSAKAAALVETTDVDLVIKDLALAYKREPWSSRENDTAINSILYPEQLYIISIIGIKDWVVLLSALIGSAFAAELNAEQPPDLISDLGLASINYVLWILTVLYTITLIVRWLIKMLIIKFNLDLAWYAPISFFFKIEEEYNKESRLLLIEEKNIKMTLRQKEIQNLIAEEERIRREGDYAREFDERLYRK